MIVVGQNKLINYPNLENVSQFLLIMLDYNRNNIIDEIYIRIIKNLDDNYYNMKLFGIDQISNAYFSGNENHYKLRKNLVKNPEVTLKEALHLKNQKYIDENIK